MLISRSCLEILPYYFFSFQSIHAIAEVCLLNVSENKSQTRTQQSTVQLLTNKYAQFKRLHGPSMFVVKAKIYGVLYNQASSIAFDETLHGLSMFAIKAKIYGVLYNQATVVWFPLISIS